MDLTDTARLLAEQGVQDFVGHSRHLFAEALNPCAAAIRPRNTVSRA